MRLYNEKYEALYFSTDLFTSCPYLTLAVHSLYSHVFPKYTVSTKVFSFVYDYETCQLLAAPICFREDMGIEEPADGVNFHSGKNSPFPSSILAPPKLTFATPSN
ncbi:hypothetical protein STEG23_012568, partial [Scotinomys teguina]